MSEINDTLIRTDVQPVVCTKEKWTDEWTVREDLFVLNLELSLTSIGRASFVYHYGAIQHGTDNRYIDRVPLELDNHFVKVVVTPTDPAEDILNWYGIIIVDELDSHGAHPSPMNGNQSLTAYSLEYILTRIQLTHTILDDGTLIRQAVPFNAFKGDRTGNRSQIGNRHPDGAIFARDLSTAVAWSAKDIVEYVARYCGNEGPVSAHFEDVFLTNAMSDLFDFTPETIRTAGQTVYQLLDSLFSPQRGLAWRLVPSTIVDGSWRIEVFSIADESITLPSGVRVSPAAVQKTFEAFERRDLLDCTLQVDRSRRYDRIVVEGGPFGSVFTVSVPNNSLEPDWLTLDEAFYRVGAVGEDGYSTADLSEKKTRNDAMRTGEKLRHVFARWRVPKDWNFTVSYASTAYPVFPLPMTETDDEWEYNSMGDYDGHEYADTVWPDSLRFMSYLPLKTQTDYTTLSSQPESEHLEDTLPDFRRPFVVMRLYEGGFAGDDYVDLSNVLEIAAEDEKRKITLSASVEVHDHQLGITLHPSKPPHCLQREYKFDAVDSVTQHSHYLAGPENPLSTDYLYATVYARSTNNVIVRYPEFLTEGQQYYSELVIRLGDKARVDYILPGTIIDVTDFKLRQMERGRIIRDDRLLMQDIALRAWQYCKGSRNVLNLKLASIYNGLQLGDLITRIQLGGPTYLQDGNGAYIATAAGSTPDIINNELLAAGDGAVFTFNGVIAATGNQTTTPGTATPGQKFIAVDGTNRQVNTVVSRVILDFVAHTTQVQTQFAELNFAGVFHDA